METGTNALSSTSTPSTQFAPIDVLPQQHHTSILSVTRNSETKELVMGFVSGIPRVGYDDAMMSHPKPKPPSFKVRKQALNKYSDMIFSTQQQFQ
jgi:hypothetical protein